MGPQCPLSFLHIGVCFTISPAGNWTPFSTFYGLYFPDPTATHSHATGGDFSGVLNTPGVKFLSYRSGSVSNPIYHNKPSEHLSPVSATPKSIFNRRAGCLLSMAKGWAGVRMGVVRDRGQSSANTFLYLFTKHTHHRNVN